jgi:uncharacterized protein (TIGR02246 family)
MGGHGPFETTRGRRKGVGSRRPGVLKGVLLLLALLSAAAPARAQGGAGEVKRKAGASSAAEAAELARARRAIDEGNARAVRAWATGDPELFASVFSDDGLELRPDGSVVRGRRRIVELVRASMKRLGPGVELTVKTTGVWLDGATAYESGKSVYKYTQDGQPKTFETLFVSVWKRQRNGVWKLYADMPVPRE